MDDVQEHLRALRRLFRQRLDDAAEGPGAELVDLSVVETTVSKAVAVRSPSSPWSLHIRARV